jgi:hypothetical protein
MCCKDIKGVGEDLDPSKSSILPTVGTNPIHSMDEPYTGCPRRNVPDFGRVFIMLKHTDITQNTYVQS